MDDAEVKAGLAAFEPVWESLSVAEQSRLLNLLIEKVVYDGSDSTIAVTFRPTGIKELADLDACALGSGGGQEACCHRQLRTGSRRPGRGETIHVS